jgi:sensor histidine kinase YesM
MLNKTYRWQYIMWLAYLVYQFVELDKNRHFDFQWLMLKSSYVIVSISTFYLFYFFVWRPYFHSPRIPLLVIGVVLGLSYFIGARYLIEEVLYETLFGFGNYYDDSIAPYALDNIWRSAFYGTFSLVVFLIERRQTTESTVIQLRSEKAEAEMAFLRGQLNPHFLFNTLSFLHTKTMKLDPELSDTILKLSDMLRYSMKSAKSAQVPIEDEIALLENYTSIFRNRFEGRFFVDIQIEKPNRPYMIEPLLLIPFVENMYKHGVMNDSENPGIIRLNYESNKMVFKCRNKINTFQKDKGTGIGLENLSRRLELTYPQQYELNIDEKDGFFSTSLKLDMN